MSKKVIKCSKMFDAENEKVLENVLIFINENKIEKITDFSENIKDYEIINLEGKFVTPGLIDCHVHLCGDGESSNNRMLKTLGDNAFFAMRKAKQDLLAGFTTIRSLGDPGFVDVSLRNAINKGEIEGPRLVVSGPALSSTGGHADSHYNPYISDALANNVADGPEEFAKIARYNIKHGVDLIKFMATGGVMSLGTTVGAQQMTFEEMKAVCDIAKMYGIHTATHAHGTSGIKDAVKAGVSSVEHGMILDDECIEEMAKRGTYLVPTIIAAEKIITKGKEMGVADWAIAKANQVFATHKEGFIKARKAGVKIAFGTDAATPQNFHGKQGYEFYLLTEFGMTALEALTAATKNASELLRKDKEIGSITAGKFADIVAFDEDPRENIKTMENCVFVMKDGVVYK